MSLRKFRVPTALVDAGRNVLRRDLRRQFLRYRRGFITKEQCVANGLTAIELNYVAQLERVRAFVVRKGLLFPEGAEDLVLLKDAKVETENRWRTLCLDM